MESILGKRKSKKKKEEEEGNILKNTNGKNELWEEMEMGKNTMMVDKLVI